MTWWKILLSMAIPAIEAAGIAKENEDANDSGTDDLIGQTLVYIAQLAKWVMAGGVGAKPVTPVGLK